MRLADRMRFMKQGITKLVLAVGLVLGAACGASVGGEAAGPDPEEGGTRVHDGAPHDGPVPRPSYGVVSVEAVEEDGSEESLGVSPRLAGSLAEVRDALPMLGEAELALHFMLQAHRVKGRDGDEVFALFREAQERGIEVHPVPVLSADEGYFPNATNHADFVELVNALVARWEAEGLAPTQLVVDMEPPRELTEALGGMTAEADALIGAIPARQIDVDRYEAARAAYAELADALHAAGWRVSVTTQGTLLADYRDDDDDLRQYLNVVLEGVDWDQIDFQLYRSLFSAQVEGLGPRFVFEFTQAARAQFPDTPIGVGLGVTHPGPVFPELPSLPGPDALGDDVAAALAAGVERSQVSVYNLKGILDGPPMCDEGDPCEGDDARYAANDPHAWLVQVAALEPPPDDGATEDLWARFDAMDTLLDLSEAGREDP